MKKGNVVIRELKETDSVPMAQLANNKKIWNNVLDRFPYPYSEKDAREFIAMQKENDSEKVFAIDCEGRFCGCIGLILQKDVYRKSAEIGYWIGEPFWGRGMASEAVAQLVNHAFGELGLVRLYARIFEYNRASMQVMEKNGFIKEGIAKKQVFKNGQFWNEHQYARCQ